MKQVESPRCWNILATLTAATLFWRVPVASTSSSNTTPLPQTMSPDELSARVRRLLTHADEIWNPAAAKGCRHAGCGRRNREAVGPPPPARWRPGRHPGRRRSDGAGATVDRFAQEERARALRFSKMARSAGGVWVPCQPRASGVVRFLTLRVAPSMRFSLSPEFC